MFNDRFAQLIARKLSGEATEPETRELDLILAADPQAKNFYEAFSDYWVLEPQEYNDGIQEEIHFQQIIAIAEKEGPEELVPQPEPVTFEEPVSRIISMKKILIAAVFMGVIVTSYLLTRSDRGIIAGEEPIAVNEVVAQNGVRTRLMLPDGTKVWLNSESKLEYKDNFNGSVREVTLEGEAFFDVVKDRKRPFIVHTSDIDIKVLGTAFNVKSYPRESSIETTLIHGLIEVTNKKEPASPKVILRPHEKLVIGKGNQAGEKRIADEQKTISIHKPFSIVALPKNIADTAVVETSWVYNKLVFDGETFRENAVKMERWYNVKFRFLSDKVANIPIHYKLENETIEEALKALQYIEPFTYKINGNIIEILRK